jgi:hypothetical protein
VNLVPEQVRELVRTQEVNP